MREFLAKQQELYEVATGVWCRAELWKNRLDIALQQGHKHPKEQELKENSLSAVTVLNAQMHFASVLKIPVRYSSLKPSHNTSKNCICTGSLQSKFLILIFDCPSLLNNNSNNNNNNNNLQACSSWHCSEEVTGCYKNMHAHSSLSWNPWLSSACTFRLKPGKRSVTLQVALGAFSPAHRSLPC